MNRFVCRSILPFILSSQLIFAQDVEWIDLEFKGQACLELFDVEGELYAVTGNGASIDVHPSVDFQIGFYRIDLEPESTNFTPVKLISIPSEDRYAVIAVEYIETTKEWLVSRSSLLSEGRQLYQFILLDDLFNIKSVDSIELSGYPNIFQIHSDSNRTYLLGSLLGPPQNILVYLHYNFEYIGQVPEIIVGEISPQSLDYVTSMKIDPVTSNMYIFYVGGIQVLDSNLNQIAVHRLFEIGTGHHGDILKVDNHFYTHGLSLIEGGIRRLVLQQYDTSFTIQKTLKLGNTDIGNYPFVSKSIDYKNNELLVGAHLDGPPAHLNAIETVKEFYLAKYNLDLELIWYKEFGGDNAHWFTGLKILDDQSCMAYGFITDTIEDIRYPYIMRVDEHGNFITSTTFVPDDDRIQITNNGQGDMHILNPNAHAYQIALYDISGKKLLERRSSETNEEIELDFIPSACIVYSVLFKDGAVNTGLFMKN